MKPTHIAYIVEKDESDPKAKGFWREVGAVWQHGKGGGFDVVIFDQLAVSGRITCRERKEKAPDERATLDPTDNASN